MSDVDICNLALGHIGDTANIASLQESSVQAQLCKKFYPMARKTVLELATWGFATTRVKLAQLANNPTVMGSDGAATWQFAYQLPAGVLNAISVISAEALSDYEMNFGPWPIDTDWPPFPQGYVPAPGSPVYTPQPYALEIQGDGTQIVLTNVCDAVLRFTIDVTDTTKFDQLFVMALSHQLASMLAGPIIKGDAGRAEAKAQLQLAVSYLSKASASDANQRKTRIEPSVPWIRGR